MNIEQWVRHVAFYSDLRIIDLLTIFPMADLRRDFEGGTTPLGAYERMKAAIEEAGYPQKHHLKLVGA